MGGMNYVAFYVFLFALAFWMLKVRLVVQFGTLQKPSALNCLIIFSNLSYLANVPVSSLALIFIFIMF